MYKQYLFLLAAIGFCSFLSAQPNDTGISIHKNSRIDQMLKKQLTGSTSSPTTKQTAHTITKYKTKREGYRIMVLNTNDRALAYKTKGQLLSRFPEQQVYMSYQTPFFKLKIGDFTSKSDAENLRKELAKTIPKGVFVVREMVIVTVNVDEEGNM